MTVAQRREELIGVLREMETDHACPLAESRNKLVFGAGNADADLMFVGEAPGANEDQQGLPFVGRAGKLLDELLVSVGIERLKDAFTTNVLNCRPPGNRDPLPNEIEICKPFLFRKIELIEPKVVVTLGNFATKLLSGSQTGITKVHGVPQTHTLGHRTVTLFPSFHPSAGLRTPAVAEQMREDFKALPGLLG
ncbi:MAG: uracil-DNA glycosylase [Thermoleophilaceae bacterium]|nr:uracil-DNA glycosylase [Thermoleophilaceae bacterium]